MGLRLISTVQPALLVVALAALGCRAAPKVGLYGGLTEELLMRCGSMSLLFGWLFWRRGLELPMMAHAFAHLFSCAALSALTRGA